MEKPYWLCIDPLNIVCGHHNRTGNLSSILEPYGIWNVRVLVFTILLWNGTRRFKSLKTNGVAFTPSKQVTKIFDHISVSNNPLMWQWTKSCNNFISYKNINFPHMLSRINVENDKLRKYSQQNLLLDIFMSLVKTTTKYICIKLMSTFHIYQVTTNNSKISYSNKLANIYFLEYKRNIVKKCGYLLVSYNA